MAPGVVLLQGPRGVQFLVSEVILASVKRVVSLKPADFVLETGPATSLCFWTAGQERCHPRHSSRAERLKAKVEPLST